MQALSRRCGAAAAPTVRPFGVLRPVAFSSVRSVPQQQARRQCPEFVCRAAAQDDVAEDMVEYEEGGDVDYVMTSSAVSPTTSSEKVKLRIRMRAYEVPLLQQCADQIEAVAQATGAIFKGPVMLPTRKKLYCVLRSPHVNKDAREHFEIRIHHRLVDLKNLSAETVAAMMEWVPPAGVEVECSIA